MGWILAIRFLKDDLDYYLQNGQIYDRTYYESLVRKLEAISYNLSKPGEKYRRNRSEVTV